MMTDYFYWVVCKPKCEPARFAHQDACYILDPFGERSEPAHQKEYMSIVSGERTEAGHIYVISFISMVVIDHHR